MIACITTIFCSCQSDTVAVKTQNSPCDVRVFVSARPSGQLRKPQALGALDAGTCISAEKLPPTLHAYFLQYWQATSTSVEGDRLVTTWTATSRQRCMNAPLLI
jgi:hypothetical protein